MTVTVQIYESLKDYAESLPVVEILGVTAVNKSVADGYVFSIGENEEHVFPKDTIFVVVENEDE